MDEPTFQLQLHMLKQQVADMAIRHSQTSPTAPQASLASRDVPLDQMGDLKTHYCHLAGVDREFTENQEAHKSAAAFPSKQLTQHKEMSESEEASTIPPHGSLALPSGPLFWQLITSLRADAQGLDSRVASLENTVADLEDEVDRVDTRHFTPPSSVGSVGSVDEEVQCFHPEATRSVPTNINHSEMATKVASQIPQTITSADSRGCDRILKDYQAVAEKSSSGCDSRSPSGDLPLPLREESSRQVERPLWTKADAVPMAMDMLHGCSDLKLLQARRHFAHEVASLCAMLPDADPKLTINPVVNTKGVDSETFSRMKDPLPGLPGAGGSAMSARSRAAAQTVVEEPVSSASSFSQGTNEGVAFRDQEIARLDELLRNSQEDLRASEQRTAEKGKAFQSLQIQYLNFREKVRHEMAKSSEKDEQLKCARDTLLRKENELQHLNDLLRTKNQETENLRACGSRIHRVAVSWQSDLSKAVAQIQQTKKQLRDCQSNQHETDQLLCDKTDEIRKLQELFERKDAVAYEQQQLIARGARLLEERDEEIEAIGSRLKGAEDDSEHERRQQARLSKLLEERDSELVDIRSGIAQACAAPQRSRDHDGDLKSLDRQLAFVKARLHVCAQVAGLTGPSDFALVKHVAPDAAPIGHTRQPFQLLGQPGPSRDRTNGAPAWSPRPIKGDHNLPEEAQRASAWEKGGHAQVRPEFGKPSPLGHRRQSGAIEPMRERFHEARHRHECEGVHVPPPVSSGRHQNSKFKDDAQDEETSSSFSNGSTGPTSERRVPHNMASRSSPDKCARTAQNERHKLPLDRTFWPPLPAPVTAQRMQSMADLRSVAYREPQKSVAKHPSMHELPRRNLQAYVEAEAESGGEFGGEVW